jgi:sugar phosphate isomerase/epimerase
MTYPSNAPSGTPRPRIAAFPKGYLDVMMAREMTVEDWISRAPFMEIEGVELYPGVLESIDDRYLAKIRSCAENVGVQIPMMCSSPDFVDPRPGGWEAVKHIREMVDVMVELAPDPSWRSVRVLSGQAWPNVSEDEGISRAVEGINACLTYAKEKSVRLVMENHYKDGSWTYPEFAQPQRLFLAIVNQIDSPWFSVNFDPSNAIVAGEDPIELLDLVVDRVKSMGASDRSLRPGYTLDDIKSFEGTGYPQALRHGVLGQGLNDYDAILSRLAARGFCGWISIEDGERRGEEGFVDIRDSARFLRERIAHYWPDGPAKTE